VSDAGLDDFNDAPRDEPDAPAEPFVGIPHADLLSTTFEDESDLVDGTVPKGALGTIAGVPETQKSWLACEIASAVALGEGEVLGRNVVSQGPVGYFWQDDSKRAYAERVQLFSRVRETPVDLRIRWFLNEGVTLPGDVERIAATVERYGLVLVVVDSVYNFVPPAGLKDTEMGALYADLKWRVCDRTGATVIGVDHMPWATEANRQRLRAYGDVFKGAAARFGIYIDANGSKLHVEARGNNVRGFRRTPARWNPERLALELVETGDADERDRRRAAAVEWIVERVESDHPLTATRLEAAFLAEHDYKGARARFREALKGLTEAPEESEVDGEPTADRNRLAVRDGGPNNSKLIYPARFLGSPSAETLFGEPGEPDSQPDAGGGSPVPPPVRSTADGNGEPADGSADDLFAGEPGADVDPFDGEPT
jgi:hypothetical protein